MLQETELYSFVGGVLGGVTGSNGGPRLDRLPLSSVRTTSELPGEVDDTAAGPPFCPFEESVLVFDDDDWRDSEKEEK